MARVVVLNGTSSSGKTTVARAFQELAPGVFLNFSIDSILYALPGSALERITSGADISDLRLPELVRAYYACAARLLELGHDLIIDNAVVARYQAEHLVAALSSHHVLMVGLDCPAGVLIERERERGDRRAGMAVAQQTAIHSWLDYDLLLDTSRVSAREAAEQIAQALDLRTTGAFAKTRARIG